MHGSNNNNNNILAFEAHHMQGILIGFYKNPSFKLIDLLLQQLACVYKLNWYPKGFLGKKNHQLAKI